MTDNTEIVATIEVTAEHIEHGQIMQCDKCPVALAIADKFPEGVWVHTGPSFLSFMLHDVDFEMRTPSEVVAFMSNFDNREKVEPFSFEAIFRKVEQ